jgi:AcrR family transcriptional regulator
MATAVIQPKAKAAQRILGAARLLVARGGAADISMGDVAAAAGVSKALVHYHFHDKASLLSALVREVASTMMTRARAAMPGFSDAHTLDAYWSWLDNELQRGDIRVLRSLAEYDSEVVRSASRAVAEDRRDLTSEQLALLFAHLGLTLPLPVELLADTVLAFIDGLAAAHALEPDRNPRPSFDVFWLALLRLAE